MNPYDILINMIKRHDGQEVLVYLKGEEEPWELERIDIVHMEQDFVFIEGMQSDSDGVVLCINLESVTTLAFQPADPKNRKDIDPETRKLKAVNN